MCVHTCTGCLSLSHGLGAFSGPLKRRYLVFVLFRFGVIHSVFTNLLLWANSVLNESKHQLNEHKERLITLGFGNITIGEEAFPLLDHQAPGEPPGPIDPTVDCFSHPKGLHSASPRQ